MEWTLLNVLAEPERREVLAQTRRHRFGRNEVIFHEGDPGDTLHLVARGHVGLRIHTPLGDVATARVVPPGGFFGELALIMPGPRNATAIALDAVETVTLNRDQLRELRTEHVQVNELLLEALVSEVRRLSAQLVETMYLPVDKRLWRRINELTATFGNDRSPATELPLTQDVIAELTGCTRASANRVLRSAEQEGVIRMSRGRVAILDVDAIRRRGR